MNKVKIAEELLELARQLTAKDSDSSSEDITIMDTVNSKLKGLSTDLNGVYTAINRMNNADLRRSLEKSLGKVDSSLNQFRDGMDKATRNLSGRR